MGTWEGIRPYFALHLKFMFPVMNIENDDWKDLSRNYGGVNFLSELNG